MPDADGLHGAVTDDVDDRAGFGATVPRGPRPALVVVDACGDRARVLHDAALFDLQAKYADVVTLDDAVSYLDAPLRKADC